MKLNTEIFEYLAVALFHETERLLSSNVFKKVHQIAIKVFLYLW